MNNREIKFRAWDKIKNKMYHFNEFWLDSEYQSIAFSLDDKERKLQEGNYSLDFYQEDLSELMQFTGLHDKNGLTDIYEDDIISIDGVVIGNKYENYELLKDTTNILIQGFGTEDWETTNIKAMERGCKYSK